MKQNSSFALKGNVCFSTDKNTLVSREHAYVVCENGKCAGVFSSIVGLAGTGMSITALPGMLLYLNGQLGTYLIACLIGFITAFVLTYVMYKPVEE